MTNVESHIILKQRGITFSEKKKCTCSYCSKVVMGIAWASLS